ncbi:SDR family NAD(P)-dependent oxidoreductase [Anabaena sp. FACHB-1237]|uniref:type I polyketide synthase n=1 Tax=Anabaena sp. FACHB-1237 TaxID=2692769 RepID=UPI00168175BB|nr:type I polyketide synthase [Anabaena sp. FACHB-1237]MBD2136212.1 SDR family NAD(P)-dependent oxidoreductase [Anabaena sp. FACHB-1237]
MKNQNNPNIDYRNLMQNAIKQIDILQEKLDRLENEKKEPIAIIGMGCRLPGNANSPDAFWQLLEKGIDGISPVPNHRWNNEDYYHDDVNKAGKIITRDGGFINHPVDKFDTDFFSISPREAQSLDPQQRLLLEVCWEALENSHQVSQKLFNSLTGVFIGISSSDYSQRFIGTDNIDAYFGTGNAFSAAVGRLSYFLGLTGPSLAVDTACSSSLVAVHIACQSLRLKECNLALAGGVNLMLTPDVTITFSQAGMLAPDGRCKTFDASANGYVRGEGCGVIILKRLSDAIADNDNILAVIRGSAVNQDGPSGGLTVPNGPSQEAVIHQALNNGNLKPADISYIEAHGTGTSLGDPIEIGALGAVFAKNHNSENPLIVGSAKTNIGHLEAAAGIAGLIKLVLQLQHQKIAPHLHFTTPNPYINWSDLPVVIPTKLTPWEVTEKSRIGAVSSFGFSGTNSHIIVEEYPQIKQVVNTENRENTLTLSAKTEDALKELVKSYHDYLISNSQLNITDICYTSNVGRSHFQYRLGIVTSDKQELISQLENIDHLNIGYSRKTPKISYLCSGQGSQYIGMGRELYNTEPIFKQNLDKCREILFEYIETDIIEIIHTENDLLDQTAYTQPALFAIEYSLYKTWEHYGIKPDIVLGHSIGEYPAACIAGIFSLEDGLKLIAHRGKLMQKLPKNGKMVAVQTTAEKIEPLINQHSEQEIAIAAYNGTNSIVISGNSTIVDKIVKQLEKQNIKTKQLQVSHAFHSPLMQPILDEYRQIANQVNYNSPKIPIISNLTGEIAENNITTAEYWVNHIIKPVKFAQSIQTLQKLGYTTHLEIGPKPVLLGMASQIIEDNNDNHTWLPSLRPGTTERKQILQNLASLYTQGADIKWENIYSQPQHKIQLPTYPFQRQSYWVESANITLISKPKIAGKIHPLLGQKMQLPGSSQIRFESKITKDCPVYLNDHRIYGSVVFLGAGYLEMALAAGKEIFKTTDLVLEEVSFISALILPEKGETTLHFVFNMSGNKDDKIANWEIYSFTTETEENPWKIHAKGKIKPASKQLSTVKINDLLAEFENEGTQEFYNQIIDLAYGPLLRNMEQVWQSSGKTLSKINLQPAIAKETKDYIIHPALLDSCFQTMFTLFSEVKVSYDAPYIPIGCQSFQLYQQPENQLWTYAQLHPIDTPNPQTLSTDVYLYNLDGKLVAFIKGLQGKKTTSKALFGSQKTTLTNLLYDIEWREKVRFGKHISSPLLSVIDINKKIDNTKYLTARNELNNYREVHEKLEQLSLDYVIQALLEIGWNYKIGDTFTSSSANHKFGVIPLYERLLHRMLQILAEAGIIKELKTKWQIIKDLPIVTPEKQQKNLLSKFPQATAELTLLHRCASQLSGVLIGKIDPVELVFPQGDLTVATQLYQNSPVAQVMNKLVAETITISLQNIPSDRGIKLLEIGAGTGGTTSYILPHLNSEKTEYVFSDIGSLFTSKAQAKFADYPFISYKTLDIEKDPISQGFQPHSFDIIIAANVIHATQSIAETLTNVQKLLVPGGMLVLLEVTTRQRWLDLIFGLLDGWWRFTDTDLRADYPLLSPSQWQNLLNKTQFKQVVNLPQGENLPIALSQQSVIIANSDITIKSTSARNWLILADDDGVGEKLAEELSQQGETCYLAFAGSKYQKHQLNGKNKFHKFTINPRNPDDFAELINTVTTSGNLYGVVQCWSLNNGNDAISSAELANLTALGCGSTLFLVQAIVNSSKLSSTPRLWLVTQGVQPAPTRNPIVSGVSQSALWGMGKVISLEHPELKCVRIDLDPHAKITEKAASLALEIWSEDTEDQIALRYDQDHSDRYVARLIRSPQTHTETAITCDENGTYLITGGWGGLGLLVARWLIEKGAKNLVLVGRNKPQETAQIQIRELEQAGAKITLSQGDVTDFTSMEKVITNIEKNLPPLKGVIHSVGVLADGILRQQKWANFETVMYPKVQGSWHLHKLTQNQPLDFFVLFSSVASLLGSPGQSNHSSANAFLDGLAHYRRQMGLPGLSINLSAVSQIGSAAEIKADVSVQKKGVDSINPQQVLDAMELLMSNSSVQTGVVPIEWSTALLQYNNSPFLADWQQEKQEISTSKSEFLQELLAAIPSERKSMLESHVSAIVGQVLGFKSSRKIGLDEGFFELGMDSLTSVDLRNKLQSSLGCSIPMTGAFDYPTINDMVNYLITDALNIDFVETQEGETSTITNSTIIQDKNEDLDSLSEDEIALLLAAELNN